MLDLSIQDPSGDVLNAVGYQRLEFQEEVRPRDINLEVISLRLVCAWRLGVSTREWGSELLAERLEEPLSFVVIQGNNVSTAVWFALATCTWVVNEEAENDCNRDLGTLDWNSSFSLPFYSLQLFLALLSYNGENSNAYF